MPELINITNVEKIEYTQEEHIESYYAGMLLQYFKDRKWDEVKHTAEILKNLDEQIKRQIRFDTYMNNV